MEEKEMAKQKAHSQDFLEQMKRLVANWPVDEVRGSTLLDEYAVVWNDVGDLRFRKAVDSIIATSDYSFFPNVAQFRGYIPAKEKHKFCGECTEGWVMKPDFEARRVYRNDTAMIAVACECRGPDYWERMKAKPDYEPVWEAPKWMQW